MTLATSTSLIDQTGFNFNLKKGNEVDEINDNQLELESIQ